MKTTIEPRRVSAEVLKTLPVGAYFRYRGTVNTEAMHLVVLNQGHYDPDMKVMNLDTHQVFTLGRTFSKQTVDTYEAVEFTFRQK